MDHGQYHEDTVTISPRASKIIVLGALFLLLAVLAVILRIWARRIKGSALRCNDYAIIAALVCPYNHMRKAPEVYGDLLVEQGFELGDFVTLIICGSSITYLPNRQDSGLTH